MTLRFLSLLFLGFILTGCATVQRGVTDTFRVDSVPQGAAAVTSIETSKSKRIRRRNPEATPEYKGCEPTPCQIKLPRKSEFILKLEYPNYEPAEIFVTNSTNRVALVANVATSVKTTAVSTVLGASALSAGTSVVLGSAGAVAGAFVGGSGAQAGFALGSAAAPSTGAVLASSIPPALAVTGSMLLVDATTGANRSLYPNPVVLKLAPEGSEVKKDPLIPLFNEKKTLEGKHYSRCIKGQPRRLMEDRLKECNKIRKDLGAVKAKMRALIDPKNKTSVALSPQTAKPKS